MSGAGPNGRPTLTGRNFDFSTCRDYDVHRHRVHQGKRDLPCGTILNTALAWQVVGPWRSGGGERRSRPGGRIANFEIRLVRCDSSCAVSQGFGRRIEPELVSPRTLDRSIGSGDGANSKRRTGHGFKATNNSGWHHRHNPAERRDSSITSSSQTIPLVEDK
jgi:hypothetical protein